MIQEHKYLYWIWAEMMGRCNNPNNPAYVNYGGRGISVCEEWRKPEVFISDMFPRPDGMTLDRINNEKGYSKDNCAWVSRLENNLNKRVYKNSPFGISGISIRNGKFRVRIRRNGRIVFTATVNDFFEACCLAKTNSRDKINGSATGEIPSAC